MKAAKLPPQMKHYLVLFFLMASVAGFAQQYFDVDQSVKMTAVATADAITVSWIQDPGTTGYDFYRREYNDESWGAKLATFGPEETEYVDTDVTAGRLYEYKVEKFTEPNVDGFGYVLSAYQRSAAHKTGSLLVVLSPETVSEITAELADYLRVVQADGWLARILLVDSDMAVHQVKEEMLAAYDEAPFSAMLLLDDVPIAFSGDINPDAHADHKGAWASDSYYGDLDGIWTDTLVDNATAEAPVNHNVPGDGKWDQSFIPSDIEVAVGRVDFRNLSFFSLSRYELLRRYLRKDVAYRTRKYAIRRRAAMRNANPWQGALGQNGIRNFSTLVSPDSIEYDSWENVMNGDSYLWYYGAGGDVRNPQSWRYALGDFQAVFTAWFSSYVGDYGLENNYMKAVLGSGKSLTSVWAGAPHWHFHAMAMGYPISHSTVVSQNNDTIYTADFFPRGVHVNLLGDPTLKSFVVEPPDTLLLTEEPGFVKLSWVESDEASAGYYLYRRTDVSRHYTLIDSTTSSVTTYRDACPDTQIEYQYLVRAAKLETTPSGSFYNLSSGAAASITPVIDYTAAAAFSTETSDGILTLTSTATNAESIRWELPDGTFSTAESITYPLLPDAPITITLIVENRCSRDTLEQNFLPTATVDPALPSVRISPNPARDGVRVTFHRPLERIELISGSGRVVRTFLPARSSDYSFQVTDLPRGIYVVRIRHSEGDDTARLTVQ